MKKLSIKTRFSNINILSLITNIFYLTLGGLILAVNVNLFLAPNTIAPGGLSGIAIIINHFTNFPIGLVMFILNIPLLILGFRYLGRGNFLIRSVYVILLYNLGTDIISIWFPFESVTDDLLLNALYGGALGGSATGLVFRGYGTPGGTGILGRLLQIKTGIPLSQVFFITDGGIVFIAGLVFGWEMALYAIVTLFVWGIAADFILEGPSVVRTVIIVTDKPSVISDEVFRQLKLGITSWPAQGMYTESKKTVMFCTINRPDVNALRSIVINVDSNAFIVIGHGHQTYGGVIREVKEKGKQIPG